MLIRRQCPSECGIANVRAFRPIAPRTMPIIRTLGDYLTGVLTPPLPLLSSLTSPQFCSSFEALGCTLRCQCPVCDCKVTNPTIQPMQTPDDLPWPELGNVSRGATRGNQGQKGALGPSDQGGCCVLQLRVQPGVLCVKLNRRSSEWYRTLDNEVNRALKLTKTYWRKARRRQD